MITVLIVDDHEITRAGIKNSLQVIPNLKVIGEASNGSNALQLAKELNPQVVLMDIHMSGIDGLETTRKMMISNPLMKIIVITTMIDDPYPSRLLEAGAMGYLTKGCASHELIKAIQAVMLGKRYVAPSIAQLLALKHVSNKDTSVFDTLTLREMQLVLLLIEGKDIKYVADIFFVSPKTLMTYRNQVFKKLSIKNEVQLVLLAKQAKLIKQEPY